MSQFIAHHGIKGQRWGVRRYENEDGTLTEAGKRRYDKYTEKINKHSARVKAMNKRWDRRLSVSLAGRYITKNSPNPIIKLNRRHYENEKANRTIDQDFAKAKEVALKAKRDPKFKNSNEYQTAMKNRGRHVINRLLLGRAGEVRAERYRQAGSKNAGARVAAEQLAMGVVLGAGMLAANAYIKNKMKV